MDQALPADDKGLLQGVLAANARVARGVCEADPGRVRRELPAILGAVTLEGLTLLEVVVESKHELIVRRTIHHRQADSGERSEGATSELFKGRGRLRQARLCAVLPGKLLEAVGRDPDPRPI